MFEHDCVVIPQFGGFVGNYKPAKLDRVQNKFTAPSKEIGFNINLSHNDGLLASRISREENITYEEANVFLKKFSENLKSDLQLGKKVELEQVGVLFYDQHRSLQFEPDSRTNFLIDSFGLSAFHSPVINKTGTRKDTSLREKTADIVFADRPPVKTETATGENRGKEWTAKRIRKYVVYVAAAIPLLFFLIWIPFNIERISQIGNKARSLNYSNLIPFFDEPAHAYAERKEVRDLALPENLPSTGMGNSLNDTVPLVAISLFEREDAEFSDDKKILVKIKDAAETEASSDPAKEKNPGRFHVIGGCFQYIENAEKYVAQLRSKGFNAVIVDKNRGLYRVCYQSFPSRKDALSLLAQVRNSSDNSAWLLVKNR